MKRVLLFIITIVLIHQSISAYPISPRTLRKLVKEAELVVWARVLAIKELEDNEYFYNARAILVIEELLQGSINQDTITVHFSTEMICPAPAHYEEGKQVLAFLDKNRKGNGYSAHALSYGAKTLAQNDYQVYKKRIVELQEIEALDEGEAKRVRMLGWIVACAKYPATRWEGTYELSAYSDFMSFYDEDTETIMKQYELLPYHKKVLAQALFTTKEVGPDDMGIIDIVAIEKPEQVLDYLQEQLINGSLEFMWFRNMLMERIAQLSGRPDLNEILEKLRSVDYFDDDHQQKSLALARDFVKKLR